MCPFSKLKAFCDRIPRSYLPRSKVESPVVGHESSREQVDEVDEVSERTSVDKEGGNRECGTGEGPPSYAIYSFEQDVRNKNTSCRNHNIFVPLFFSTFFTG